MFSDCNTHTRALSINKAAITGQDRRGKKRYITPLTVIIGNTPYTTEDWSFGGIRLRDYRGLLGVTNTVDVRIMVPSQKAPGFFRTSAKIVRCHPADDSLALAFTQIDALAKSCLTHYIYAQA